MTYEPTQREFWWNALGNVWFEKNRDDIGKTDMVSDVIERLGIKPTEALEVGCSNGWRLHKLKNKYGCNVYGIDPSETAIAAAHESGLNPDHVVRGTADRILAPDGSFDVIIFGFCFCFIAPEDWVQIVHESHRLLRDGGHIIIHDFIGSKRPIRNPFKSMKFVVAETQENGSGQSYIYRFDCPSLWLWHPAYHLIYESYDWDKTWAASVLKKDMKAIWNNTDIKYRDYDEGKK